MPSTSRPVLDEVSSVSHELSEAEYEANSSTETRMQPLLSRLALYLTRLQQLLTPGNFEQAVELLLQRVGYAGP